MDGVLLDDMLWHWYNQ